MNLYIFAIGGTGSRVLTSLIMQLAAGIRPVDPDGKPIKDLTIVPIIIDPHEGNGGLQKAKDLLDNYRYIRKQIYGDKHADKGFFSVKIATLHDLTPSSVKSDTFFFKMTDVSVNKFESFIKYDTMSEENRLFTSLLFSEQERATVMKEGFYGSPNIGCVALNEFKNSADFKAFLAYHTNKEDKIYFIGSIFGGTGAAGLPLFIKSFRDFAHYENQGAHDNSEIIAHTQIGALIVMPYFSIAVDSDSEIQMADFISKTKSALRYYDKNLNNLLNACYYIADTNYSTPYPNDSGKGNQKGNKAHLVEWVSALSVLDFLSTPDSSFSVDNDGKVTVEKGHFKQYGLASDIANVDFTCLGPKTKDIACKAMIKFHLFKYVFKDYLSNWIDSRRSFVTYEPPIEKNIVSSSNSFQISLSNFFDSYEEWLTELGANGEHSFAPFNLSIQTKDLSGVVTKVETKKRKAFGRKKVEESDLSESFNEVAKKNLREYDGKSSTYRLFDLADEALNNLITDFYEI